MSGVPAEGRGAGEGVTAPRANGEREPAAAEANGERGTGCHVPGARWRGGGGAPGRGPGPGPAPTAPGPAPGPAVPGRANRQRLDGLPGRPAPLGVGVGGVCAPVPGRPCVGRVSTAPPRPAPGVPAPAVVVGVNKSGFGAGGGWGVVWVSQLGPGVVPAPFLGVTGGDGRCLCPLRSNPPGGEGAPPPCPLCPGTGKGPETPPWARQGGTGERDPPARPCSRASGSFEEPLGGGG